MNKLFAALMLSVGLTSVVFAEQVYTTQDGAFSVTLPDGNVQEINDVVHRVVDLNNTEAVGAMEVIDNNGTPESNSTANLVQATLAAVKDPVLLSNVVDVYSGYQGRQYSIQFTNDVGTRIIETIRAWTSNTGHTLYAVLVVELVNNPNQSRVDWYLNSATFHPEHMK